MTDSNILWWRRKDENRLVAVYLWANGLLLNILMLDMVQSSKMYLISLNS